MTQGGSFGSGSSSSDLLLHHQSYDSYTYVPVYPGSTISNSDVLVYSFDTNGSFGSGQVGFDYAYFSKIYDVYRCC